MWIRRFGSVLDWSIGGIWLIGRGGSGLERSERVDEYLCGWRCVYKVSWIQDHQAGGERDSHCLVVYYGDWFS